LIIGAQEGRHNSPNVPLGMDLFGRWTMDDGMTN
jgi:hypothetical protein